MQSTYGLDIERACKNLRSLLEHCEEVAGEFERNEIGHVTALTLTIKALNLAEVIEGRMRAMDQHALTVPAEIVWPVRRA
ncbi:MAG: hypothetical protein ACR2PG_19240 [Hyphomicrobiaceae bacterium]